MLLASSFADFWKELYHEAFGHGMGESVNDALNPPLVNFFGLKVNPSLYTAVFVSIALILLAVVLRIFVIPRFKEKNPSKFQILLESFVSAFDGSSREAVGHEHEKNAGFLGAFVFTASTYIALGTLVELFGLRPAFASINTCFAMGISAFLVINYYGFKERRLKRFARYANPLNIITDLSVPLSLSLRLFGSITSGFIIMELLYSMIYASFVLPAAVSLITTIFHAVLQSYLFATLTGLFVGEAIEG